MITVSNVDSTGRPGAAPTVRPAILTGGSNFTGAGSYLFLYCATGRDNTTNISGNKGTFYDTATRTATSCYMRGLKENIEINTSSGLPWQWRRICFTSKAFQTFTSAAGTSNVVFEDSAGFRRPIIEVLGDRRTSVVSTIFQGAISVDWNDYFSAKTDSTRITTVYDKTKTIACGNEDGMIRKYQLWHPMNKNLVYDDDETGGTENPGVFSTYGKPGMGDYWVMDIFQPRVGSTSADQLYLNISSTLYWHEK